MEVSNIINVRGNKVANQFVIKHNGSTYFQSYDSLIAAINSDNKLSISPLWDYSPTTRRHFYTFLNTYWAQDSEVKRVNIIEGINNGNIIINENINIA